MREILFRAKSIDENNKGEWVQGYYRHFVSGEKYDRHYIDSAGEPQITTWIDIETLGQYTGIKDKNGDRVFEGDILQSKYSSIKVVWHDGGFCGEYISLKDTKPYKFVISTDELKIFEVIGNIHDKEE